LFRKRQRNEAYWGNTETDDLIATMIETTLRERPHRKTPTFFLTSTNARHANSRYRGNRNTPW
jgi:hypothetical protein